MLWADQQRLTGFGPIRCWEYQVRQFQDGIRREYAGSMGKYPEVEEPNAQYINTKQGRKNRFKKSLS